MTNIDATTPQLKAVKGLYDAYTTLDIKNLAPHLSKNFKLQSFPKVSDVPDEARGGHLEKYEAIFSLVKKLEFNFYEVIEAPGKVVTEWSATAETIDGTTLEYASLSILTLGEEDGELKVLEVKDFSDPEKRGRAFGWVAKTLASGKIAA